MCHQKDGAAPLSINPPKQFENICSGSGIQITCGLIREQQWHQHVFQHTKRGYQMVKLKNKTDGTASQNGTLSIIQGSSCLPCRYNSPQVGLSSNPITFNKVLLPDPDGPTNAAKSFWLIVR